MARSRNGGRAAWGRMELRNDFSIQQPRPGDRPALPWPVLPRALITASSGARVTRGGQARACVQWRASSLKPGTREA